VHVTCVCPSTLALHNQFSDSLASILLSDEILRVLELDSVSQTLRLLGAPVEPIFDVPSEIALLGTIKASQVVVLNEISVVVTQRKLMLTAISFDFVEKHNLYIKSGLR